MHAQILEAYHSAISGKFRSIPNEERKRARDKVKEQKGQDYKVSMVECKGLGPKWMKPSIWERLIDDYWAKEKWLEKSEADYANRMSEKEGSITKHSCGLIPIVTHKKRMIQEYGREPNQTELFDRTAEGKVRICRCHVKQSYCKS